MLTSTALNGRSSLFVTFAALAAALAACSQPKLKTGTYSSGSLALSSDGKTLYIADDDNNQLVVVDPSAKTVTKTVNVGNQPTAVVVGSNGDVFVSNRQSRSVSVVDPVKGSEITRINVGTEPTGMALSADGKTLVVACTTNSNVAIIDVPSLTVRATVATDPDPNGVSILPNGEAWVTHIRQGSISRINLTPGQEGVIAGGTFSLVAPLEATSNIPRLPEQPVTPVVAGSNRLYVVHSQSVNQAIDTIPTSQDAVQEQDGGFDQGNQGGGNGGSYAEGGGGGPDGVSTLPSAIVAGAIATIDTENHELLLGADAVAAAMGNNDDEGVPTTSNQFNLAPIGHSMPNVPAPLNAVGATSVESGVPPFMMTVANQALSGPSAAIVDATGSFLFIAHKNSNNVAIVQTSPAAPNGAGGAPIPTTISPPANGLVGLSTGPASLGFGMQQVVSVGAGPNGIAIPASNDRVYVYNSFDHSVSVIMGNNTIHADVVSTTFQVGTRLTGSIDNGRRLFFSATDPRMTSVVAGGIACASCHPGGRDDGRTWTFTEGPRNTPSLAGRDLLNTAPYHWDGLITSMPAFNSVITNRMGGAGDGTGPNGPAANGSVLAASDFQDLQVFLDSQAAPDNPFVAANDPASVQRGAAVFTDPTVGCAGCHNGQDFTDNLFHNVGTMTNTTPFGTPETTFFSAQSTGAAVNTPTLRNIFNSAPYIHDGSDADLLARVNDDRGGQHGNTAQLSSSQKNDLVAYLQTL